MRSFIAGLVFLLSTRCWSLGNGTGVATAPSTGDSTSSGFTSMISSWFSPQSSRAAEVDSMIDSFATGCRVGPWTQAALLRSRSMTSVLQNLKAKAECVGIDRSLNAATALENALKTLSQNEDLTNEALMTEQLRDMVVTLQSPNLTTEQRDELMKVYSKTQVDLAQVRQRIAAQENPTSRSNVIASVSNTRSYLSTLITESSSLTDCYSRNPSAALQVATGIAEVAGSFLPSVAGMAVSTVSKMIEVGVEYARTLPISQKINESLRSRLPVALTCGLEVLTRDYCRARDARTLVDLERSRDKKAIPFFAGIDFIENALPTLNSWLFDVENGVKPVNQAQAVQLTKQFERLNQANSQRRLMEGIIAETRMNMQNAPDQYAKDAYIRLMVLKIVGLLINDSPDSSIMVGENTIGLIQKMTKTYKPVQPGEETAEQYVSYAFNETWTVPNIESNLLNPETGVFVRAYREVVRIFSERVNVDPPRLVRAATVQRADGVSPLGAMKQMVKFLDNYQFDPRPAFAAQERELIQTFRNQLIQVINELSKPEATLSQLDPANKSSTTSAETVLALIYDTFKLQNSNVYVPGRISRLVSDDLTNRTCEGQAPKSVQDILILAGRDISAALSLNDLTPFQVRTDIDAAQALTSTTLSSFRGFFAKNIAWTIQDKLNLANYNKEPLNGQGPSPNRNVAAQLCLMTLISGMDWPKEVDIRMCRGLKIFSREAKIQMSFDEIEKRLKGRSFEDHVCIYEDFLRIDELAFTISKTEDTGEVCDAREETLQNKQQDFKLFKQSSLGRTKTYAQGANPRSYKVTRMALNLNPRKRQKVQSFFDRM